MTDVQREQIRLVVDQFNGKPVNQNALNEFCDRNGIDKFDLGSLEDYTEQVNHDNKISALLSAITPLLQRLKYIPEFAPAKERKDAIQSNNDVEDEIAELIESHGVKYKFLTGANSDISNLLRGTMENAGNMIFNKLSAVIMNVTHDRFGEDLNTMHIRKYIEDKRINK